MAYKRYFESVSDPFVKGLLDIQDQVKIYHWQTTSYASHKALGDYYDAMSILIDKFVEEYQGQFGRIPVDAHSIQLRDISSEDDVTLFVANVWQWLTSLRSNIAMDANTSNLQNTLDEMIGETSKLKYLLTLK